MATKLYLRKMRKFESVNAASKTPKESIGQKSKRAHALVKSGTAKDLKEAWKIIKSES